MTVTDIEIAEAALTEQYLLFEEEFMQPDQLKNHVTTYWNDDETKMAVLSTDTYHWIVELFSTRSIRVYTQLFDKKRRAEAEAYAEDWINDELQLGE